MASDKFRLTLICLFVFIAAFKTSLAASGWSYDDDHGEGPNNWKKKFQDCGKSHQSPINIQPSVSSYRDITPLQLEGYDSTSQRNIYKLMNNGHTVQLNVEKGEMIISSAGLLGRYKLIQFHLHWGSTNDQGSEHTVDGRHFPMEIHFVHFNTRYRSVNEAMKESDGLAVVGVFFEIKDKSHPTVDQLIEKFCQIKYSGPNATDVPVFRMDSLLPEDRNSFYRYNGSLTTPGCNEVVTWTVLTDTVKISQSQLNSFRALGHNAKGGNTDSPLADNFRPVQPLGGRLLLRNHDPMSRSDATTNSFAFASVIAALSLVIGVFSGDQNLYSDPDIRYK